MSTLLKKPDFGLFFCRLSLGVLITIFGFQNLLKGPSDWAYLGQSMNLLGISFGYVFWGFLAVMIQTLGGLAFILGAFFRWACFLLFSTLLMAVLYHVFQGHSLLKEGTLALVFACVFFSYLFIGPGSFSIMKD
jgi:putative oxidoreductase